jgi:FkbM family methyltransferase
VADNYRLLQDHKSTHERVLTVTLDDLVQNAGLERIDLLKMDIEGAEYPVLLSTAPETLARVRCLVLEYHEFEAEAWRPAMLVEHL